MPAAGCRAAFACGAIVSVFSSSLEVARLSTTRDLLFNIAPGVVSPTPHFGAILLVALLAGVVNLAVIGIEIWWVLRIGEFAEASGWRAKRNRILGAWSFLIPIVNYWFPYQAIRDAQPPDQSPADTLRWWLWYILGPLCTGIVLTAVGIVGNAVLIAIALAGATAIQILIAVLGWQLVDELDQTQDNALAAIAA